MLLPTPHSGANIHLRIWAFLKSLGQVKGIPRFMICKVAASIYLLYCCLLVYRVLSEGGRHSTSSCYC